MSVVRERLNTSTNASYLSVTSKSNRSAFEDKLSPLCQDRQRKDVARLEKLRIESLMFKIKLHTIFFAFFAFDLMTLGSSITSFLLLFGTLPNSFVFAVNIILLAYLLASVVIFFVELSFPNTTSNLWNAQFRASAPQTPSPEAKSIPSKMTPVASKRLDRSIISNQEGVVDRYASDNSWIDAHEFGTPPAANISAHTSLRRSPAAPASKFASPSAMISSPSSNRSMSDASPLGTSILADTSATWKCPSSYVKPTESIHTRKQLDVLLKSNGEDQRVDLNASQSTSYLSLFNVFDFGRHSDGTGHNTSYQLSEDMKDDASSPYKTRVDKNGRVELRMKIGENDDNEDELTRLHRIMHNARTSPNDSTSGILKRSNSIERGGRSAGGVRRRSSQSSPDRNSLSSVDYHHSGDGDVRLRTTGSILTEEQQKRAELKMRVWLRNTIVKPLADHIDEINALLEKEHSTPALHIGTSSVDSLKLATIERDSLKKTALPFLLPFLNIHSNQAYFVSRVKELSASEFMDVYKWNGGGMEPSEDKLSSSVRVVRREWNDSLPTDAALLFDLFSVYMDSQLNSNCLVGDHRLDQPFTGRYVLKAPRKPSQLQRAPYTYYLHMASSTPPNFEFIHSDGSSHPIRCHVSRNSNSNLFRAIVQFINHVKEEGQGYIDQTSIGPSGVNLTCVLN